jgi:predicted dehydrogenase
LRNWSEDQGLVFDLMHNYTGYPMVKLARDMVRNGDVGDIRKIVVQYPQGWLATALEKTGQMQASWRTDPKQSGAGGCVGDIGTHAANLAEYISGLKILAICAELTTFVPGRPLDDDCNCLLKFDNGAKGVLHASQIAIGEENNLAIWVHGEKASLEWHQEDPNYLYVRRMDKPEEVWKRGNGYVAAYSAAAARNTRLPCGHPEAFLEAFANNYTNFAETIKCIIAGEKPGELVLDFPGVEAGVRGMLFIETVVASSSRRRTHEEVTHASSLTAGVHRIQRQPAAFRRGYPVRRQRQNISAMPSRRSHRCAAAVSSGVRRQGPFVTTREEPVDQPAQVWPMRASAACSTTV